MIRAFFKHIVNLFKSYSDKEKRLSASIKNMVGSKPLNVHLFVLAVSHSSIAKTNIHGLKESNERLEFLGDAILGSVVADYLFKKFPSKDEGFLTEIRSRIVNRESLNLLARKIGVNNIVEFETAKSNRMYKSIYGNTLEALVGAVYLDRGYGFCKSFIVKKLLFPHFDINELVETDSNFKSKIIEWAQKENKDLNFEITNIEVKGSHKEFTAEVMVEGESAGIGFGSSKKRAEQAAAARACEQLHI